MPLTLARLEEIQCEAMADDIPIELARMALWTDDDAVAFFESGGETEPAAPATLAAPAAAAKPDTPAVTASANGPAAAAELEPAPNPNPNANPTTHSAHAPDAMLSELLVEEGLGHLAAVQGIAALSYKDSCAVLEAR